MIVIELAICMTTRKRGGGNNNNSRGCGLIVHAEAATRLGESLVVKTGTLIEGEESVGNNHFRRRRLPHFQTIHIYDGIHQFNDIDEPCPFSITSYTAVGKNRTSDITITTKIESDSSKDSRCSGTGTLEIRNGGNYKFGDRFFFTHASYNTFCPERGTTDDQVSFPVIVIVGQTELEDGTTTEVIATQWSQLDATSDNSDTDTTNDRDNEPGIGGVTIYLDIYIEGIHYKYDDGNRRRKLKGIMQSVEPVLENDVAPYQYVLDQSIANSMIQNTNLKC